VTPPAARVLGVIPARSGSRRVPAKNTQPVGGRPLIVWTIDAARRAALDRVVVSTDSEAIAALARDAGADVPGLRPASLAADDTPGIDPVLHVVEKLESEEGYRPDYVVVLQPTSPLRTAHDIEAAIDVARRTGALSVASVCRVSHPQSWLRHVGRAGELLAASAGPASPHSEPCHVLNGAIYLVERQTLLQRRSLYAETPYAYVMPAERSLDVDTAWDLHLADLALRFPFQQ
jgi:CMP-N-acetylneuraminic acid synthetase